VSSEIEREGSDGATSVPTVFGPENVGAAWNAGALLRAIQQSLAVPCEGRNAAGTSRQRLAGGPIDAPESALMHRFHAGRRGFVKVLRRW
jgi:hypothetical protein